MLGAGEVDEFEAHPRQLVETEMDATSGRRLFKRSAAWRA